MEVFLYEVGLCKVITKTINGLFNGIAKMSVNIDFLVYTFTVDSAINIINEDNFKGHTVYKLDTRTKTSRMSLKEEAAGLVDFLALRKVEIVNDQVIVIDRKISHS